MKNVFRGWRRKAGVVSLVVACALFSAWFRSALFLDAILLDGDGSSESIVSCDGALYWIRMTNGNAYIYGKPTGERWTFYCERARQRAFVDPFELIRPSRQMTARIAFATSRFCGFGYKTGTLFGDPPITTIWQIPYWALVLAPTLLSAYLILWKPRKRSSPN